MHGSVRFLMPIILALFAARALAQPAAGPPADDKPVARIEAEGPLSYVSSLAFSPDGKTLYAAGWDKRVHVWRQNDAGTLVYERGLALRIPLGPGQHGHINALAVSPDGRWLAVGGYGMARNVSGFRDTGKIWPKAAMSDEMRLDIGQIHVFDTRTRAARILRGHTGPVLALAFAPTADGKPPLLVSAAREESTGDPIGGVRVWDVAAGSEIARLERAPVPNAGPPAGWPWQPLPDPGGWKPELSAWHSGNEVNQLRVAIAWGDNDDPARPRQGRFRVWDVATRRVSTAAASPYVLAAQAVPARDRPVVTGSYGQIGVWTTAPGGRPGLVQLDARTHYRTIARLDGDRLPRAGVLIAPAGGGASHAAFVVEERTRARVSYELVVADLNRGRRLGAPLALWSGAVRAPSLAASSDGRRLAIAGAETNEIQILDAARLVAGQPALVQTLRMSERPAEPLRSVAFMADAQGRLGLSLSEELPGAEDAPANPVLFDIAQGEFRQNANGWERSGPEVGTLEARRAPAGGRDVAVEVLRGGAVVRRIVLEEDTRPTALAVCPAGRHFTVPLVAVASEFRGEPILGLYNADTGDELRRLTGHVEAIRSVVFSADGSFLASAGEDWTVCVWRLTDLGETLGQLGLLKGLAVDRRNGRLVVRDDPEGAFEPGDEIAAVLERGAGGAAAAVPFDSTWGFYNDVSRRRPGTEVAFRVVRNGRPQAITAVVDQGIDERKPLFSLFVTPDRRSWIGWHPVGKYDAGDRAAETYLGWHFNTGQPGQPARFASVEQYREDNFTPGLLQNLIEGQPPVAEEPPEPKISLQFVPHAGEPLERHEYEGHWLARAPELTAIVRVDDYPARFIRGLEWSFDGGAFQAAAAQDQTDRGRWEIDLSTAGWKPRRVQQVAVRLVPLGRARETFSPVREDILFVPSAPTVNVTAPRELSGVAQPIVSTREPKLTISARIAAGHPGEAFTVELRHQERVVESWASADGTELTVDKELDLASGGNTVSLTARNTAGQRDTVETTARNWLVNCLVEPEPPAFVWKQIVPEGGGEPFSPAAGDGRKRFIVDVPQVRIQGQIEAPAALQAAELTRNPETDGAKPQVIAGFQAGTAKALAIDELVALQPGRQTVRFRARTTAGKEATDDIELEYRPKLPSLAAAELRIAKEPTDLVRRWDVITGSKLEIPRRDGMQPLTIQAEVVPPADPQEFVAEVLVDDVALPAEVVQLDGPGRLLRATIPSPPDPARVPDTRRVHIRLSNAWGTAPYRTAPLAVTFLHTPEIVEVSDVQIEGLRIPRLTCIVAAPESRPPQALELAISGRPLPAEQIGRPVKQDGGRWTIEVSDVPLEPGANELVLVARNSDGASPPFRQQVTGEPPASPLPEIELVSPAVDSPLSSSRLTVEFRVRSMRPLRMVDLVVATPDGGRRRVHCLDRLGPADPQGFRTFQDTIELAGGANSISVEAVSDGLTVAGPVVLNVLSAPVELLVERLVPRGAPGSALVPEYRADGLRFGQPLPGGQATLVGRITGNGPDGAESYQLVRMWVNGFLRVAPVKNGAFEIPVVLNLPENRLQLEVPYQAVDEANRYRYQQVHVNCAEPEEGQHLHLLIVGANPQTDAGKLRQRVESAFHLDRGNQAFVYQAPRVLAGDRAMRHNIRAQLTMLRWRMARRPGAEQTNDVLMIYYEGRAVERDGEFVLLDQINWNDPARDADSAVTSRFLADYVNDAPGAHLVLLDVQSDRPNPLAVPERWPPHLGVLGIARQNAGPPDAAGGLISAIGTAIPGNGLAAASEEVRLRSIEAAVQATFDGPLLHASDDLRNLLLARAGGTVAAP